MADECYNIKTQMVLGVPKRKIKIVQQTFPLHFPLNSFLLRGNVTLAIENNNFAWHFLCDTHFKQILWRSDMLCV